MAECQKEWDFIFQFCENFTYEGEGGRTIRGDSASNGLSLVLKRCRPKKILNYLSGSGADEIISWYKRPPRNMQFPQDLSTIFPWVNFYGGKMRNYIMKEEIIGGAHGIETRYPFLDKEVVQEFFWLSHSLKNMEYGALLTFFFVRKKRSFFIFIFVKLKVFWVERGVRGRRMCHIRNRLWII